jgi:TrkA domain protein
VTKIHETELPGVGIRQEFDTVGGVRLGVLTTRSGRRELLLYDREDTDACRAVVHLDPEDSATLTELLGAGRVTDTAAPLQRLEGLAIDWLTVPVDSPLADRSIADAAVRKTTGASIVAIIHGTETNAAPGPDNILAAGDVLVTVGTPEAVDAFARLLRAS